MSDQSARRRPGRPKDPDPLKPHREDWTPRDPGQRGGKDGRVARRVVLTELGWAQVSPDVRRRIGR